MFTIKQVAGLTGVSEATLRAWQGRYGIVTPRRSAGGYRLYSEEQVALLREMASLVAAGVPASRAAATLLQAGAAPDVAPAPGASGDAGAAGEALLRAAADLDPVTLAVAIADAAPDDFEVFADRWLPLRLRELGDAWAAGVVGVAGEHFVCAGLMRAIAAEFERAPTGSASGRILVGLPPGARHEVMLFAFATCLRRLGADVVYLGADVPAAEWERAAASHRARAAVVGVTAYRSRGKGAQEVIDKLATVTPPVSVFVGGSRRGQVTGAQPLPDAPSEAARLVLRSLLAGRL